MIRSVRAVAVTVAFLAAALAGQPGQAAEPAWSQDFATLCLGNLKDFKSSTAKAISQGYVDTGAPAPPRYSYFRLLRRSAGGQTWKLAIGELIDRSTSSANFIVHCLVEGEDDGTSGADAIKTWVGMAPAKVEPGYVDYVFALENGALKSLAGASRDVTREAFFNGGYWLLSIEVVDGLTSATLSYTGPVE